MLQEWWNTCAWGLSLRSICAALFNLRCWTLICSIPQRCLTREAKRLSLTVPLQVLMDMTTGSCSGSEESYAGTHFIWSEMSRLVLQTVAFCHCLLELFKCRALAIAGGWVLDLLSELTWLQWCFAALQRSSYKNSRVRAVKYFRSEIEWIPFLFLFFLFLRDRLLGQASSGESGH